MGNTNSGLPAQALPGSTLQTCLLAKLPRADITFAQDITYTAAARTFNAAFEYHPSAIVRPKDANAVSEAVKCAVQAAVKVSARCGGHGYAAYSIGGADGHLVVDLVQLQKYEMNKTTWTAKLGGGSRLGDVDSRMQPDGRVMSHGTCPRVGLGGHATMGGLGPTSRMWGSALDHVLEAEVVLANGTIVRANKDLNPDLYWAVKGAGSSFGIVTEFVVRTQPIPSKVIEYSYNIVFGRPRDMAGTFKAWQNLIRNPNLDRRLASQVTVTEVAMLVTGTFFGSEADFNATGFPQALGSGNVAVFDDWLGTVAHWAEKELLSTVGGISVPFYSKSLDFTYNTFMSNETIDALFNYIDTANKGTLIWTVIFDLEGGAINDVAADATAYGHRDAAFYIQTYGINLVGLSQTTVNFLNGIDQLIRSRMSGVDFGAYAGYIDPGLGSDAQRQYFKGNLPRLQQLKKVYDPNQVYWNPQSIKPV